MVFILGNEKLLTKSRFYDENNCWDYSLEELDHVIESNTKPDMVYVIGNDKRIYETDCKAYELNDLYEELNQTPKLRRFELAALSIGIKLYVKYGMDAAIDKLEKWKEDNKNFNPNLDLVKEHFECIIEPFNKQKLKNIDNISFKMEEEKAYIMFVLAYDLLQEEFKNCSEPECDLAFEKCNKMAEDFLKSKFNTNTKGLYDCLVDYVESKRYVDFMVDNEENNNEL